MRFGRSSTTPQAPPAGLFAALRRVVRRTRRVPRVVIRPTTGTSSTPATGTPDSPARSIERPPSPNRFHLPFSRPLTPKTGDGGAERTSTSPVNRHSLIGKAMASLNHDQPRADNDQKADNDSFLSDDSDPEDPQNAGAKPSDATIKSKSSRGSKKNSSKWVAKLLNQVGGAPPKDKVHRRKKRRPREGDESDRNGRCHVIFTQADSLHITLLCSVMSYLMPHDPARQCASVNTVMHLAVQRFYRVHCSPLRPRAFLAQFIFGAPHAANGILYRVLGMLPFVERVHASTTNLAFRGVSDAHGLDLRRASASRFGSLFSSKRIAYRFNRTRVIRFDTVAAVNVVRILRIMSDDEDECFRAVTEIAMVHIDGFSEENTFVQLVQALFSDRISRSLRKFVLSGSRLQDLQFRHLSSLFYGGRFPLLEHLDLSRNAFSSRFMRDWARSFQEDRLRGVHVLDITGVGMGFEDMERFFDCLTSTPALRELYLSNNRCNLTCAKALGYAISSKAIVHLQVLNCCAMFVDAASVSVVLGSFRDQACVDLKVLDLSGNPLVGNAMATTLLAEILQMGWWPKLKELNLTFTRPGERGIGTIFQALEASKSNSLVRLYVGGNAIRGEAMEGLAGAMESRALRNVQELNLSENALGPYEFQLLARSFRSTTSCPLLQVLNLSGNRAGADGIARFQAFFSSLAAKHLSVLDLSGNEIPAHSQSAIADTLRQSSCLQLRELNLTRNMELRSVVRFQEIAYVHSRADGMAFVKHVMSSMSVEELRRRKQAKFDDRMVQIERTNQTKAARAQDRCKQKCRLLRVMYNHMESEGDRALRRRKQARKSTHLHIHEEIERLKQEQYHKRVCRTLKRTGGGNQGAI